MKECLKFYINGEWVDPVNPQHFDVINPATEESIGRIALGNEEDLNNAVAAAKNAFDSFSQTTKEERIELIGKIIAFINHAMMRLLKLFLQKWARLYGYQKRLKQQLVQVI